MLFPPFLPSLYNVKFADNMFFSHYSMELDGPLILPTVCIDLMYAMLLQELERDGKV